MFIAIGSHPQTKKWNDHTAVPTESLGPLHVETMAPTPQTRGRLDARAQVACLADSMHGGSRLQMGGASPGSLQRPKLAE